MTLYVPSKQILAPELLVPGNKPARALRTVSGFDGEFYPFFAEQGTKSTVDAASGEIYANAGTITHNGGYITVATANTNYAVLKPHLALSAFTVIMKVRNVSGSANHRIWSHKEYGADDLRLFVNGLDIYFDPDDGSFTRLSTSVSSWADWVTIAITHTGSYQKMFLAEGNHARLEIVDESSDTLNFTSATGEQVFFGALSTGTPGAMGGDGEYVCFVPDRAMSDEEVVAFAADPYALLDPIGPEFAWVLGGGGVGYTLVAETGSYAYTGYDASLLFSRVLTADTGSYTYTGYDANLLYGYSLQAETGNYVYTGYDADFLYGYSLQADTGSYAYTGFDANLVYTAGYTLVAETGSYSYTGYDVNLLANRILTAETGAYTYTGFAANLVYVSGYTLQAETGSYGYTGYDANLLADRALIAETGPYTYTGYDANLRKGFTLAADTGNYTYTGYDAGFAYNRVLAAETGSYIYTGYAASFVYSGTVRIVNFNTYILQIPDELVALQIMGNIKVIAASDATAAIQSNRHREHNRRH